MANDSSKLWVKIALVVLVAPVIAQVSLGLMGMALMVPLQFAVAEGAGELSATVMILLQGVAVATGVLVAWKFWPRGE